MSYRMWGMNLVAADGEIWRKHRRVLGPAFNNKLWVIKFLLQIQSGSLHYSYEFVWNESIQTFKEMVANDGWMDKKSIEIPIVQRTTFKVSSLPTSSLSTMHEWLQSVCPLYDWEMCLRLTIQMVRSADCVGWYIISSRSTTPYDG